MRASLGLLGFLLFACSPSGKASQPSSEPLSTLRAMPAVAAHVGAGRTLVAQANGYLATSGVLLPRVSDSPVHLASAERTDVWIDVAPTDVSTVEGRVVDGAVSYPDVAPGTDLVWADDL